MSGAPASAGRATGSVRVIRGPHEFDELQPGEILVAPLTAPAWTPLFTRAAAVVTDVGSAGVARLDHRPRVRHPGRRRLR